MSNAEEFLAKHKADFFDDARIAQVERALLQIASDAGMGRYQFADGSILMRDDYACSVVTEPA